MNEIKVGDKWLTRDGHIAVITAIKGGYTYPVRGRIEESELTPIWYNSGRYFSDPDMPPHALDLISKIIDTPPAPDDPRSSSVMNEIKVGDRFVTRDGKYYAIITEMTLDPVFPIKGMVTSRSDPHPRWKESWTSKGKYYAIFGEHHWDLIDKITDTPSSITTWPANGRQNASSLSNLNLVPPKKSGSFWANVYDKGAVHCTHRTREQADQVAAKDRIACIEVKWEEGQGLEK